ncbi:hypothetical protein ACFE04_006676 [Oxalis oulophora]
MLSLDSVIGAIAAGNALVLKSLEIAPASSSLLERLVPQYFDNSVIRVVEGGEPETSALLEQIWNKIFYTGSFSLRLLLYFSNISHLRMAAVASSSSLNIKQELNQVMQTFGLGAVHVAATAVTTWLVDKAGRWLLLTRV